MSDIESSRIVLGLNKIVDKFSKGRVLYIFRVLLIAFLLCLLTLLTILNISSYLDVSPQAIRKMLFWGLGISIVLILGFIILLLIWFSGRRLFRVIRGYNVNLYSHTLAAYELMYSIETFSKELYLNYLKKVEQEISNFTFGKHIFSKRIKMVIGSLLGMLIILSFISVLQYRTIRSVFSMPLEKGTEGPGIIVDIGKVRKELFFPSYTGMESITKYDSGRLIEALKGSILRITIENVIDAKEAYLVYQNTRARMERRGGRFTGDMSLVQSGYVRVDFIKSGLRYSSGDFKINIINDDNPEIFLSGPEEILRGSTDARPDRKIEISYTASDDYGVSSVSIVVSLSDGKEKAFKIKDIVPPQKEFSSEYIWDYSEIAKYVQGELMFALEAEDNDTVSGPKRQRTRFYKIVVPRSSEGFVKDISLLKSVRSAMLRLLSTDLTYENTANYINERNGIYVKGEIIKKLEEYKERLLNTDSVYKELVRMIGEVSFHNGRINSVIKRYRGIKGDDYRSVFEKLTRDETAMLEKNILVLQDIIEEVVYVTLQNLSNEISSLKQDLRALVDKYEQTKDEEIRVQIMAVIALLEERLKEYSKIQSELNSSFSEININKKAVENLSHNIKDMVRSISELKEGLVKDEMQDFKDRLKRLEDMVGDMEKDFSNLLAGLDRERYRELMEAINSMSDEIKGVIDEQRRVSSELSAIETELKKRYYETIKERLNNLLQGIIEDATRLKTDISQNAHIILKQSGPLKKEYTAAVEVQTIISQMIEELRQKQIFDSLLLAGIMVEKLEWIKNLSKMFSPDKKYHNMTAGFYIRGKDIRDRINAIIESAKSALALQDRGKIEGLIKREQQVSKKISELSNRANNLSTQFGHIFEKLSSNLEGASQSSGNSVSAMKNNNIPLARSNTDDSISKLDDAMKELSKLSKRRMKMLSYNSEGEEMGGQRRFKTAEVKFPKKEDFKPDEKMREEIMKAITDEGVKGYEEFIRKYYEEIIR